MNSTRGGCAESIADDSSEKYMEGEGVRRRLSGPVRLSLAEGLSARTLHEEEIFSVEWVANR